MNIQIDTLNKILKLQESVNLGEFSEIMLKLFPNNEWKEYKLETNTVINNWSNPIIIERQGWPYQYPWWSTSPYLGTGNSNTITYKEDTHTLTGTNGTYNLAIN